MEFTDYMWLKFWAFVALAFVYGLIRGLNGKPLQQEQNDK